MEESIIKNTNKKWELVNFCEFDPHATKSYCGIHNVNENLNLGDITQVNEKEMADFNMMVGGSPCQDFSVAGKQEGAKWTCKECGHEYNPLEAHYSKRGKCPTCSSTNIEKTRSSLLVEWLRILREKKPNFAIYENVKNIVGKQFRTTFDLFERELNEYGYSTYWKVLNAKNYGIPQNRERVYLIIIKKELDNSKFEFPKPLDNGVRLKDVLEKEVDDKFYISQEKVARFVTNLNSKNALLYDSCQVSREGKAREYNEYSPTITSRDCKDPRLVNCTSVDKSCNNPRLIDYSKCITARENRGVSNRKAEGTAILNIVGRILPDSEKIHQNQEVYDSNNIMGTIKASHYKDAPKVLQRIENSVQQVGNIVDTGNWDNPQRGRIYSPDDCSPALNCCGGGGLEPKILEDFYSNRDIREYRDIAPTLHSERNGLKVINSQQTINGAIRGRYTKKGDIELQLELNDTQVLNALTTVQKDNVVVGHEDVLNEVRIRKLTPKECFRLMGFSDEQFNSAKYELEEISIAILKKHPNHKGKRLMELGERIERMSNSQLYKQAGNSIVVDVLFYILVELYKAMPYLFDDVKLSSFFSGIGAFECSLDLLYERIINFDRSELNISKCEICGGDLRVKHNRTTKMFLCEKHCKQIYKYGATTDSSNYNQNDKNDIEIYEDCALIVLKNKSGDVVAKSIIDFDDIELIEQYKWTVGNHGYITSGAGKEQVLLHRLLSNAPSGLYIDHINLNKLDNRKANYRFCTNQENNRNKNLYAHNSSGVTGVTWDKKRVKWQSQIVIDDKNVYLGRFDIFEDAVVSRLNAEKKYFKDFMPENHIGLFDCINSGTIENFTIPQVE